MTLFYSESIVAMMMISARIVFSNVVIYYYSVFSDKWKWQWPVIQWWLWLLYSDVCVVFGYYSWWQRLMPHVYSLMLTRPYRWWKWWKQVGCVLVFVTCVVTWHLFYSSFIVHCYIRLCLFEHFVLYVGWCSLNFYFLAAYGLLSTYGLRTASCGTRTFTATIYCGCLQYAFSAPSAGCMRSSTLTIPSAFCCIHSDGGHLHSFCRLLPPILTVLMFMLFCSDGGIPGSLFLGSFIVCYVFYSMTQSNVRD